MCCVILVCCVCVCVWMPLGSMNSVANLPIALNIQVMWKWWTCFLWNALPMWSTRPRTATGPPPWCDAVKPGHWTAHNCYSSVEQISTARISAMVRFQGDFQVPFWELWLRAYTKVSEVFLQQEHAVISVGSTHITARTCSWTSWHLPFSSLYWPTDSVGGKANSNCTSVRLGQAQLPSA